MNCISANAEDHTGTLGGYTRFAAFCTEKEVYKSGSKGGSGLRFIGGDGGIHTVFIKKC
jgi:hypothetical protein